MRVIKTERKKKCDYDNIKNEIVKGIETFKEKKQNINYGLIREIPDKEDFGDLDILLNSQDFTEEISIMTLIESFNPEEIEHTSNCNIYSFNYTDFQIDFIRVDSIPMAQFFYDYGDIGPILGKIFSTYGFKFGQLGLSLHLKNIYHYQQKDDETLFLSDSPSEICKFFDYDYQKWLDGFKSVEECFKWIISSKYFRKNIFINNTNKKKKIIIKRPMYIKFIEYISTNTEFLPYKNYINLYDSISFFNKTISNN